MLVSENLISSSRTVNTIRKTATSIVFPVDDVTPATDKLEECTMKKALSELIDSEIEMGSGFEEKVVANIGYHPVIAAALLAFDEHRPLVLSPDIVWITIAQGVAQHINLNAETLRYHCVSHQNKLTIAIKTGFIEDWQPIIQALSDKIKQHVGEEMHDLFVADFSTTGKVERMVSEVVMMDAFKQYFDFVVICICGIPTVTLEGTTADWILLREKVIALKLFGLKWWTKHLLPICDQFIRASKGDIDLTHWQNLCKLKEVYGDMLINGWIVKLIAYVRNSYGGDFNVINPLLTETDTFEITSWNCPLGLSLVPLTFKNMRTKLCLPSTGT